LPEGTPRRIGIKHYPVSAPTWTVEDQPLRRIYFADKRHPVARETLRNIVGSLNRLDKPPRL